jgi:glycerate kinase
VKTVLAFDKFKGCLTADQACEIVRPLLPGNVVAKPMADGGDGTAAVLHAALGGQWCTATVTGPVPGKRVVARYLWLPDRTTAVIEMAAASGLALLRPEERDPLRATTFGTGELIRDAIAGGAHEILLTIGGSATVDAGVGAAQALGWRFLDQAGNEVGPGGGELARIVRIVPATLPVEMTVFCDVDNPLCGPTGAARVFGPQKGASPAMVGQLEAGLSYLASIVRDQLGVEMGTLTGGGAAGGLAAGAVAFCGARLAPGVETVMQAIGLEEALRGADWVITGEGRFDEQSLRGKVVAGVARAARRNGAKVAVLTGSVALPEPSWRAAGVETVIALQRPGMSVSEAMARAPELLRAAGRKFVEDNLA